MARGMNEQQLQKMKTHPGFIAALDQSGGSTPNALRLYGIKEGAWSNEEEMFALVHQMRTRLITSPSFTGERMLAAILFENTMDRDIEGQPTADYLWNVKRVVPLLKVDKGLAAEKDGVQLMKPMPDAGGAARQSQSEGHLRNQDALAHQASQCRRHQGHREPAVRSRWADHRRWPRADHRAGSGHSLPGKGQGRRVAQSGHPRGAQRTASGSARHAQAHPAGARQLLRRLASAIPKS